MGVWIWFSSTYLTSILNSLLYFSWNWFTFEIWKIFRSDFITRDWPIKRCIKKMELEFRHQFDSLLPIWHQFWILSFSISHGIDSLFAKFNLLEWNLKSFGLNFHRSDWPIKGYTQKQRKEKKKWELILKLCDGFKEILVPFWVSNQFVL